MKVGVALRSSAGGVGVSASVGSIKGDVPQIVSTQSGMHDSWFQV